MISLRRLLQAFIKDNIHPKVWFKRAPDTAAFPYLIYSLEVADDGQGFNLVTLDVDGWDMSADTTELEMLMGKVGKNLDKKTLTTDSLAVSFYLDRKLVLEDTDERIVRRKYIFQGRSFERGE